MPPRRANKKSDGASPPRPCCVCGVPGAPCPGCRKVSYCGHFHQEGDYPFHMAECVAADVEEPVTGLDQLNLHAEPEAPDLASIQKLPEKVMLRILGHFDHMTLLDTIPQVCRQWQRLSRDRALWSDLDLLWASDGDVPAVPRPQPGLLASLAADDHNVPETGLRVPERRLGDTARLLQGAPFVRCLELRRNSSRSAVARAALSRSGVVVLHRLLVADEMGAEHVDDEFFNAVMVTLRRSHEHVREVFLYARKLRPDPGPAAALLSPYFAISSLKKLEHLELALHRDCAALYKRELSKVEMRSLRHFRVMKDDFKINEQVVGDVLRGASASLRHVHIDPEVRISPELDKCLSRCKQVTHLVVNGRGLDVIIKGMVRLQDLTVLVILPGAMHRVRAAAQKILSLCFGYRELRALSGTILTQSENGDEDKEKWRVHEIAVMNEVQRFVDLRPEVVVSMNLPDPKYLAVGTR